jgi:hypothetical protein
VGTVGRPWVREGGKGQLRAAGWTASWASSIDRSDRGITAATSREGRLSLKEVVTTGVRGRRGTSSGRDPRSEARVASLPSFPHGPLTRAFLGHHVVQCGASFPPGQSRFSSPTWRARRSCCTSSARRGMHLWRPVVATVGNRSQMRRRRNGSNRRKPLP